MRCCKALKRAEASLLLMAAPAAYHHWEAIRTHAAALRDRVIDSLDAYWSSL
jgi:L-lactate utilization protein LutB